MKVIIVGGVAGGMSAATRLRRLKEDAEIIVFEKGPYVSFANCGLPYAISGEIAEREKLMVQTPTSLSARFAIDVRPEHTVEKINLEEHSVTVSNNGTTWNESFDKLILSPGAKPFIPTIAGIEEAKNVFTLRNVPDLDEITSKLAQHVENAVVIGAGFIGLETAETLTKRGIKVTLVEKAQQVLPPLDKEMAAFVKNECLKNGIDVRTNQAATRFESDGKKVILEDGEQLASDLTIMAVGVQPANQLAKEAGLSLGYRGGIVVNESYQTSHPDIYAVGDAITVKNQITAEETLISLASPANRQGRQVADIIAGQKRKNKGSIGTAIVRIFNQTAAATGLSERGAKELGYPVQVVHVNGKDHASYFPGATDILLKLIFHPETGQIFGAQGVGNKGVDKRIDILATAIKAGMSVFDLPELELTYAPPFGSAKDPVNMVGYAASNLIEGMSESIQWYELQQYLSDGAQLLDVRTKEELEQGQFENFIHIPLNDLRSQLNKLDKNKNYIVSCHSGLRSYIAERVLKQAGYKVKNLDGAFSLYQVAKPEEIKYV